MEHPINGVDVTNACYGRVLENQPKTSSSTVSLILRSPWVQCANNVVQELAVESPAPFNGSRATLTHSQCKSYDSCTCISIAGSNWIDFRVVLHANPRRILCLQLQDW